MTTGPLTDTDLDAMAHEQAYRELLGQIGGAVATRAHSSGPTMAELWRYVRRQPTSPLDLAIEKAIRMDPVAARRYGRLLASIAIAHSPTAMAAGSCRIAERTIGDYRLRVAEEDDDLYLVLSGPQAGSTMPRILEMRGKLGSVRLPLSAPVRGHVTIPVDRRNEEMQLALALLSDPATELFLV